MRDALLVLACLTVTSCGWLGVPVSPLAAASRRGDVAEIQRMAASGASLDEPSGVNHWTPLMHAIHKNQPVSVEALLQAGADVNLESGRTTALIMAAGYGYAGIVQTLLDHGAQAGPSALAAAIEHCQTATVRALLDHDPSLAQTASRNGCGEIVAMLESR